MYLTFEAIESGTFKFSGVTSAHTLSYSLDNGSTWITLAHNTKTPTINVGNTIMWKGNLTPQDYKGIGKFIATGKFVAYGNIMSLLYGDDFVGQTSLTGKAFAFTRLFYKNTKVVSAQNLILPATTLTSRCYYYMFSGCTNINYIKMLATDVSTDAALYNWVYGVSSTGTFVKAAGVTIPTGKSGIPDGWTVVEV